MAAKLAFGLFSLKMQSGRTEGSRDLEKKEVLILCCMLTATLFDMLILEKSYLN